MVEGRWKPEPGIETFGMQSRRPLLIEQRQNVHISQLRAMLNFGRLGQEDGTRSLRKGSPGPLGILRAFSRIVLMMIRAFKS